MNARHWLITRIRPAEMPVQITFPDRAETRGNSGLMDILEPDGKT